jgi:site-specific DNA-methyltransferase (adenine-specific)
MKPTLHNKNFYEIYDLIETESFDLILTDPPYGILTDVQKWDTEPDILLLEEICANLLKPTGQLVVFCDIHLLSKFLTIINNSLQFRFYHIWKKPGGMPTSTSRPINDSEFILIFRRKGELEKGLAWNPKAMGESGEPYYKRNTSPDVSTRKQKKSKQNRNITGERYPKTILEAPGKPNMKAEERSNHPTQKPEVLLRKLIKGYSNPGDLILDPFAGSGSTLISAFHEGRRSVGFEIEYQYFKEARQRIENVTSQADLFAEVGLEG